jgi:hypothetical protein
MEVELEPGQHWDDELTVTMNRETWLQVLALITVEARSLEELNEKAMQDAKDGDWAAMIVGPKIAQAHDRLGHAALAIVKEAMPSLAEEVKKERQRNADA